MLDVPVPLMVEQLVDVLQFFDTLLPQVIDVPKIFFEDIPTGTPVREPRLVEEVGGNANSPLFPADLQGFLPEQSSTACGSGGLQGLRPGQGSTASSSSSVSRSPTGWLNTEDEAFYCFFRTFPRLKKSARVSGHSSARVPRQSSSSTLSAHQMAPGSSAVLGSQDERLSWYDEELEQAWCRFEDSSGRSLWHPHGPLPVGATMGALAVEVPQIQFLDGEMVG